MQAGAPESWSLGVTSPVTLLPAPFYLVPLCQSPLIGFTGETCPLTSLVQPAADSQPLLSACPLHTLVFTATTSSAAIPWVSVWEFYLSDFTHTPGLSRLTW